MEKPKSADRRRQSARLNPYLQQARRCLHVAYHSYEHYSSIRPLEGPMEGVPDIRLSEELAGASSTHPSSMGGGTHQDAAATGATEPSAVERMIQQSTNGQLKRIRELMQQKRGNVDDVIEALIEEQQQQHQDQGAQQEMADVSRETHMDPSTQISDPNPSSPAKMTTTSTTTTTTSGTRRLSTRERKEQTKKQRKRNKLVAQASAATKDEPAERNDVATKLSVLRI